MRSDLLEKKERQAGKEALGTNQDKRPHLRFTIMRKCANGSFVWVFRHFGESARLLLLHEILSLFLAF